MEGLVKHFLAPYIQKFEVEEAKVMPLITAISDAIDWDELWKLLQPAIKDNTKLQAALAEIQAVVPELQAVFKVL